MRSKRSHRVVSAAFSPRGRRQVGVLGCLFALMLAYACHAGPPREEARRLLADDFAALNRGERTLEQVGARAQELAETAETPELAETLLAGAVRLFDRAGNAANAAAARRRLAQMTARTRTAPSMGRGLYCVIALAAGPDALNYPVSYLNDVPKGADRECGTDNGTAAVGSYLPNKWCFYDMHGNVWEWCLDLAKGHAGDRTLRGGWWLDDAGQCRTSVRKHARPGSAAVMNGFRLCWPLASCR